MRRQINRLQNKKYEIETNCLVNLMEKKTNQSLTIAKGGQEND